MNIWMEDVCTEGCAVWHTDKLQLPLQGFFFFPPSFFFFFLCERCCKVTGQIQSQGDKWDWGAWCKIYKESTKSWEREERERGEEIKTKKMVRDDPCQPSDTRLCSLAKPERRVRGDTCREASTCFVRHTQGSWEWLSGRWHVHFILTS